MAAQRRVARFGWRSDAPDFRDLRYSAPDGARAAPHSDLSDRFPYPPWDQGQIGSCTAHGAAGALTYALAAQSLPLFMPSRMFIYWTTRDIEGTADYDSGAQIRDAIKAVASLGACDEAMWPYDTARVALRPPVGDFTAALSNRALTYLSLDQSIDLFRMRLTQGFPIDFGFSVYESLETFQVDATGVVPMPVGSEHQVGAHCVLLVGHDDDKRVFKFRNSWGGTWGDGTGHGTLPYDYVASDGLASDFWTLELVS